MCFSIPKKVLAVNNSVALVEGDQQIKLGNIKVETGDYLMCYGTMAVEKVTAEKALRMRKIIKRIDKPSINN